MKKIYIFAIVIILIIGGYYVYQNVYQNVYQTSLEELGIQPEQQLVETPETQVQPNEITFNSEIKFKRIILTSYNWEAIGATIIIENNGAYTVEFDERPGSINKREGKLADRELRELNAALSNIDIFSLQDEYTGQRKTTRSWINYKLIVESDSKTKLINFHSEDETAPQALHNLVNKIEQFINNRY